MGDEATITGIEAFDFICMYLTNHAILAYLGMIKLILAGVMDILAAICAFKCCLIRCQRSITDNTEMCRTDEEIGILLP